MFYGNNPFQRPMFGGQYGALSPFGKDIMDQIGRKEEGNIGGFLGEVRDMAEDRFEIDFEGNRYGIGSLRPPRMVAFANKATQADVFDSPDKATEEQPPVLMANGGAPMYADQGSQFMPAAGRPPVPASVQMANELDQIGRMKQQRESTIVQKIAEQRGVSVEEVLRLLALANAAEATQDNPRMPQAEMERLEGLMPQGSKNPRMSQYNLERLEELMPQGSKNPRMSQYNLERLEELMPQEMGQTNIPYPDAPSATVMQQGGPNPSEWDMLTEGEKMRILNNLEMGNVPRPEVALPMQEGGNVGIAALPQMGTGQPSPPMPAAPMAGIDPAMVEQALSQMEGQVPQIDDAEDYEQMMNTIRGDEQPMEARYSELAGVVGEEDAAQTPESVLALVQPVMVMASVDQGIGGLAQEEMTQPIEGEMAGGIMSMAGQPQGV
jgi:hypothetical protein